MTSLGVNIAIMVEEKVLLTKREDFEVWCLPGGAVDPGESLGEAARREAREETGLEVELLHLVGLYSRPFWHDEGSHIAVFTAHPTGGELKPQAGEVIDTGYFGRDNLPELLLFGQQQRILDALDGASGVVWSSEERWPLKIDMTRQELYAFRDASGLSRQDFFRKYFMNLPVAPQHMEVPPCRLPAPAREECLGR
jgi:ADP-ribose pyrophosphatase YjhB (NUDIX family)